MPELPSFPAPAEMRLGLSVRALAFSVGLRLRAAGRSADAVAEFERALGEHGRDPDTGRILTELAAAYAAAGRPESAFEAYLQCAELDPEDWKELVGRATDLLNPFVAEAAAPWFERRYGRDGLASVTVAPPKSEILLLLARLCAVLKNNDRAIQAARHATLYDSSESFRDRVADVLYDLAIDNMSCNDFAAAQAVLDAAVELAPGHADSHWLLVDVLRQKSYGKESPDVSPPDVRRALEVWERASAAFEPSSWALSCRGLLNEQLARLPEGNRWTLAWQELCWLERSLAHGSPGPVDLCNVGRVFRSVELHCCEDHFTAQALAVARTPEDRKVCLVERIITTANLGAWAETLELVEEKRTDDSLHWTDAIEAFIVLRRGEPQRALELVERTIRQNPGLDWCLDLRADCLRELGRTPDLMDQYRAILSRIRPGDRDNTMLVARAHYWLGLGRRDFGAATAILEDFIQGSAIPTEGLPLCLLGQCRLCADRIPEGLDLLREGIQRSRVARELQDLRQELLWIPRLIEDPAARQTIEDALKKEGGPLASIDRQLRVLETASVTPEDELANTIAGGTNDAEGWLWCAAQAALARMQSEAGRRDEAAAIYRQLRDRAPERFPEASLRLKLLDEARMIAAGQLLGDDPVSALREYENILETAYYLPPDRKAEVLASTGFALAVSGSSERAASRLSEAGQLYADNRAFLDRLVEMIHDEHQFWSVWDAALAAKLDPQPLHSWWDKQPVETDRQDEEAVLPIILEIGSGLVPGDTSANWVVLRDLIPAMRERLKTDWGITIPGIRIRPNYSLKDREYVIMLNEVPLPHEQSMAEPREADASGPDRCFEGITQHLEAVLAAHLDKLLSLDEVDALLDKLDEKAKVLRDAVLPSTRARFQFTRLLQELVRQRCPIAQLEEVLRIVQDIQLESRTSPAAVRRARLRLSRSLPGTGDGWLRVDLPREIEEQARRAERDDRVGAEESLRVIERIRELIQARLLDRDDSRVALVASNYDAAAVVRKVIRTEFPLIAVLGSEEIYDRSE